MSALPLSFPKFRLRPDTMSVFYGAPGSGKSTLACLRALQAMRSGVPVYSNVPIKGAYILDEKDIGKYHIPSGLVIIDEAGVSYNNRDFKGHFVGRLNKSTGEYETDPALEWYKKHRHEGCEVMLFSQEFEDFDAKLQGLSTRYYIVRKFPFKIPIVFCRELAKRPSLDEQTRKPIDEYKFKPFGTNFCWCPATWRYFDSFDKMNLPPKDWHRYGE